MSEQQRYLEELKEFLRIPSISTDPEHAGDIRRAAEFVAAQLRSAGLRKVGLIEKENRHPLVYGEWLGAEAGKPTLLLYGHYDVQPPDPLDEWKSPPFEPEVRGDNIYARGAADDKGLTMILIKAVERILKQDGKLPVNVRFLIEGEEETGGEHIEEYVLSKPPNLKADAAVICDTEMFAPELPTICVGLRGMVYGELHVRVGEQDMHSGVFGGAVANPIMAIAEILTALKDREGHIQIPGFYDRVQPPSAAEQRAWKLLPFELESFRQNEAKVHELTGEPEQGVLERTWARPTLEVHGIRGGFTGEGAKTVIPAQAVAKISMRLVADQRPDEALEQLRAAIEKVKPKGAKVEFKFLHGAGPSLVDPNNEFIHRCAQAMQEVFGNETVYIRSGGSIPIVGVFQQALGIPSVMAGFGLPDDNLHAPNEKLFLPNFYRGIDAMEKYLRSWS
jgi:acetylornithine deacetylase/succinyl-diaminopimelate desuccinylase-like protein